MKNKWRGVSITISGKLLDQVLEAMVDWTGNLWSQSSNAVFPYNAYWRAEHAKAEAAKDKVWELARKAERANRAQKASKKGKKPVRRSC